MPASCWQGKRLAIGGVGGFGYGESEQGSEDILPLLNRSRHSADLDNRDDLVIIRRTNGQYLSATTAVHIDTFRNVALTAQGRVSGDGYYAQAGTPVGSILDRTLTTFRHVGHSLCWFVHTLLL